MKFATLPKQLRCSQLLIPLILVPAVSAAEPVQFARDILPILSNNCYACHGPDAAERKADLRFDLESDAKAEHSNGVPIVAGNGSASTILARLTSDDPDQVMPPPDSGKTVKKEQIALLRQWIAEGARWGRHWSFEPIQQRVFPPGTTAHPIDILAGEALARQQLKLRPAASPHQLMRRLWLDLIGLPPTIEIADRFAQQPSMQAYERIVDDLLQRPQFGEHWARMWLDLARYADTKGYEKDLGRTVWPYRDWVVRALNADMPLDQFTAEQLAADLLPNATEDQLIATAFHRNTMSNDEGGTDDEEFRVVAIKDRVDTTMQVWMGLTAGCAKCHTHKYDPISQAEYYSLYALFNQTQDADRYDDSPTLELLSPELKEQREQAQALIGKLNAELKLADEQAASSELTEDKPWKVVEVLEANAGEGATLTPQPDGAIVASGEKPALDVYHITVRLPAGTHTAIRLDALPEKLADGQFGLGRNPRDPNFVVSEFVTELLVEDGVRPLKLVDAKSDFAQDGWPVASAIDGDTKTGWAVSPRVRERHIAFFAFAEPLRLDSPTRLKVTIQQRYGDSLTLRRIRLSTSGDEPSTLQIPQGTPEQRRIKQELAAAQANLGKVNASIVRLPIMRELAADKQRTTKIQRRGNFLDPSDVVSGSVPAAFHKLPQDAPLNRLGVAQWLVSQDNPLTARVWANRIWSRLFGMGIVETEEDFGALGSGPSNPQLLDWLASNYRDGGWSLKRLIKSIVMSETYRQSSEITPSLREIDPRNVMWSRGARFRLSAECVRDQALAVSGLLSTKMGGPPVMPPQPDGLWRSTYNGQKWMNAEGEDRFRRGLYTYLKRTTPYPSMTTFDGGSGEVCQIRRIRTNTPLQALVTLNDPVYLEAAAALAKRMVVDEADPDQRAVRGLRLALIRPIEKSESAALVRLQADAKQAFAAAPEKANALLSTTRSVVPPGLTATEFAAWIVTASAILNLDEFLSRS